MNAINVGDALARQAAFPIPVGTSLNSGSYVLTEVGWRSTSGLAYYPIDHLLNQTISEVGDGPMFDPLNTLPYSVLVQRLGTYARYQAHASGVDIDRTNRALEEVGAGPIAEPWEGMHVAVGDRAQHNLLVSGTIGRYATTSTHDLLVRWDVLREAWVYLTDPILADSNRARTERVPEWRNPTSMLNTGVVEILTGVAAPTDAPATVEQQRTIWSTAKKVKVDTGWCADLERALSRTGVAGSTVGAQRVGSLREAPVGSYIVADTGVDSVGVRCWKKVGVAVLDVRGVTVGQMGTVSAMRNLNGGDLFPVGQSSHAGFSVGLAYMPDEEGDLHMMAWSAAMLDALPVGTVVSGDDHRVTKQEDGTWNGRAYYRPTSSERVWADRYMMIQRIPVPGPEQSANPEAGSVVTREDAMRAGIGSRMEQNTLHWVKVGEDNWVCTTSTSANQGSIRRIHLGSVLWTEFVS